LAVELQQMKLAPPDSAVQLSSRMDELWKLTSEIAVDIQDLSHELHSSKLEYLGMVPAMRSFCGEFSNKQKVEIEFESHDLPSSVPPDISLCFFRVLQEALHNAVKHSGVRHFKVQLRGAPSQIHLTISDFGAGFDPETALNGRGLGLISMKERLHLVKGELSIDSQPRHGTTIHACIPLSSGIESISAAG
jgi:signal transduction histidine kinase